MSVTWFELAEPLSHMTVTNTGGYDMVHLFINGQMSGSIRFRQDEVEEWRAFIHTLLGDQVATVSIEKLGDSKHFNLHEFKQPRTTTVVSERLEFSTIDNIREQVRRDNVRFSQVNLSHDHRR